MITIGLVQININFEGCQFLPYSVGMLQAFVEKNAPPGKYQFKLPIFSLVPVEEAVKHLIDCQIVGFSSYIWNICRTLAIARRLKQLNPEVLIVFGGPQVPNFSEEFLRENLFIDVCCHGEGERSFYNILKNFPENQWQNVSGISYLDSNLDFRHHPIASRVKNLQQFPSPFLNHVFQPLMEAYPEQKWVISWETNRGCPFSCTFCDWGSALQSKVYPFELERVFREIEWFAQHKITNVFTCDANFGILKRDVDIANYLAEVKKNTGYPGNLSIQSTKNVTERAYQIHKTLTKAGFYPNVTLSLQTTDKETLKAVKRENISMASFEELQRRFAIDKISTYTDVIIGLPGETYTSFLGGISKMIDLRQFHAIKFFNASILPNSELAQPEYQKKYGIIKVKTKNVYLHTSIEPPPDDIYEYQELIVGTLAMPEKDWQKARALAWLVDLVFYNHRLLQLPFMVLHFVGNISYEKLFEQFIEVDENYPTLFKLIQFLKEKAFSVQNGEIEYCKEEGEVWGNVWWSADEFVFRKMIINNQLGKFYEECFLIYFHMIQLNSPSLSIELLKDSFELSQALLKLHLNQYPIVVKTSTNVWDYYHSLLEGEEIELKEESIEYSKTWAGEPYLFKKKLII